MLARNSLTARTAVSPAGSLMTGSARTCQSSPNVAPPARFTCANSRENTGAFSTESLSSTIRASRNPSGHSKAIA